MLLKMVASAFGQAFADIVGDWRRNREIAAGAVAADRVRGHEEARRAARLARDEEERAAAAHRSDAGDEAFDQDFRRD